jgi:hypothetical protein
MTARICRARRFLHGAERTRTGEGHIAVGTNRAIRQCRRVKGVKLHVYRHLFEINAGFDQVIRGLAALRKEDALVAKELDRFSELAKEVRASTNSFLTGALDGEETSEAGRRFGKRRSRELREE